MAFPAMTMPPPDGGAGGGSFATQASVSAAGAARAPELLQPGAVLADRYEILELLGRGGMGAVYKARDRVVDRVVALKLVRGELAGDASIIERFKQELILAREVTHPNVIRIYDIGQAGELKFISMEYVEGETLSASLRQNGKCTPEQAVAIGIQICAGLAAAHAKNIIHRDLKPQNIMIERGGRVLVMDFGLARLQSGDSLTHSGVVGTFDYMSPEQALGERLDARSDVFAVGLILYEMLTGRMPFAAETAVASLLRRTREQATSPSDVDASVPRPIASIVLRCLQRDQQKRYRDAGDLLVDLQNVSHGQVTAVAAWARLLRLRLGASMRRGLLIAAVMMVLAAGALLGVRQFTTQHVPRAATPIKVIVADFHNNTADHVFDGTLESSLNIALEGASFITSHNRGQAMRVAQQLRPGSSGMDEALARLVATREGDNVVIAGSIDAQGAGYNISLHATDAANGSRLAGAEAVAEDKSTVLRAVTQAAAALRNQLGDTTPASVQVSAAETYTTSSIEAAHEYAMAQDAQWAGRAQEAIQHYSRAAELDSQMGRAYAGLAVAYTNLKRTTEAANYYRKALSLLDRMSEREKYRTMGTYFLTSVRNYDQAIETYQKLVYLFPSDSAGYNNLSIAYVFKLRMKDAVEASRHALELNPNNLQHRLNFALYSMYAGDFDTAVEQAERILHDNPTYEFAYLPLGLSKLARGDVEGARAAYQKLKGVSPVGYSMAATATADLDAMTGDFESAKAELRDGIAADTRNKASGEEAQKYVALAEASLNIGDNAGAARYAQQAIDLSGVESVLTPAALVLIDTGRLDQARRIVARLDGMLQTQTTAYAQLLEGAIALHDGKYNEAVAKLRQSQSEHDSWLSHLLLGRAYVQSGHYAEAEEQFSLCDKRRGEADDLFFADTTTLRHLPELYYWQGRAYDGLGSKELARQSYQKFLKLRAASNSRDSVYADARTRLGG